MLGPIVGTVLCLLVGGVRPLLHANRAILRGDDWEVTRWLCFFVCATCFVLPPLLLLPPWWPLRREGALVALLLLSTADGAEATHRRWVAAMLAPVDRLVRRVTETTAEEALVALESWRPVRVATDISTAISAETSTDISTEISTDISEPAADPSPTPSSASVLGE